MKQYEIKKTTITLSSGEKVDKYFIHYYVNGEEITKEFHSLDGTTTDHKIIEDYNQKQ